MGKDGRIFLVLILVFLFIPAAIISIGIGIYGMATSDNKNEVNVASGKNVYPDCSDGFYADEESGQCLENKCEVSAVYNKEAKTCTKKKSEIVGVPYETVNVDDPNLEVGNTVVRSEGKAGSKKIYYDAVLDANTGTLISKDNQTEEIITEPINRVIAKGTKNVWRCRDATSYDRNPYNDNYCVDSYGNWRYVSDSESRRLDPTYTPGTSGHWYYNSK